ncbi:MAG: precorrin-2 C(20)-methyltransferase [Angelakisella sp.]
MGIKKGVFYGVGVGAGDPELMTLKAVRILKECTVIAAPQTKSGEMLALDIAKQAVDLSEKTILPLSFTMERDKAKQHAAHMKAAALVEEYLDNGRAVAMLNLGDVAIYSTYCYMMDILRERGYETVMISGVPSFCAVAARLGISLTEMNSPLHIIPAGAVSLDTVLDMSGTKVLMKSGKQAEQVVRALRDKNMLDKAAMVQNCGLPDEIVSMDMNSLNHAVGYFSTIIVKE